MKDLEPPNPDYREYSKKFLIGIPIAVFGVAVGILLLWTIMTGAPVDRAMVFTGGTELRIDVSSDVADPEAEIEGTFDREIESITSVSATNAYIVRFADEDGEAEVFEDKIEENEGLTLSEFSQVSPSLGADAQQTAILGILISFGLMSLLVISLFRSLIPAVVVLASAISDMIIPLAAMNLLGIQLSLGTVGALLMIIGYSVDSDILLNTHVMRGKYSSFLENVHSAMDTGIVMTVTSFSAMVVMAVVSTLFGISLLAEMGAVLAIGLAADLMNTYMLNVGLLQWYTGGEV